MIIADKALADRLAFILASHDEIDINKAVWRASVMMELRTHLAEAYRSGQLVTLAECETRVAAALRIHAGKCEEGESITEKYLRRYPDSKKTRSWSGAMVHLRTMNGIWRPDGHGYTVNFADAWVLPLDQARKIVSGIYEDHGGTYYRAVEAIRALIAKGQE